MQHKHFLALNLEQVFGMSKKQAEEVLRERTRKIEEKHELSEEDKKKYRRADKIRAAFEVQEITGWRKHHLGELLDAPCRECGERQVYSGYADLSPDCNYLDNYWKICLSCLDASHHESFEIFGYWEP